MKEIAASGRDRAPMRSRAAATPRLDVLDGLRGIAILLVLWYHVWEISWLPAPLLRLEFLPETGFIGVALFFFLSGAVIALPFARAAFTGTQPPSWRHFYLRRFWKIVPSYVLSIAVAYAIGYAARQGGAGVLPDLVTHLLFIHTWFPASSGAINGVLWTLAVEVEFYAIFPLLWWCFRRARLLTVAATIAASLAWRLHAVACCAHAGIVNLDQDLPAFLSCFSFGMLTASLFVDVHARWNAGRRYLVGTASFVAGIIACTLLLQSLYAYRMNNQWAAVWGATHRDLLALAFALIAFGALLSPRPVQRVLANPPLVFFGAISYALYLYHQIVARELLYYRIPQYVGRPQFDPLWQRDFTVLAMLLSIAIAAALTYWFERPLQRWGNRRFS